MAGQGPRFLSSLPTLPLYKLLGRPPAWQRAHGVRRHILTRISLLPQERSSRARVRLLVRNLLTGARRRLGRGDGNNATFEGGMPSCHDPRHPGGDRLGRLRWVVNRSAGRRVSVRARRRRWSSRGLKRDLNLGRLCIPRHAETSSGLVRVGALLA
jgi:hypothetical protein